MVSAVSLSLVVSTVVGSDHGVASALRYNLWVESGRGSTWLGDV